MTERRINIKYMRAFILSLISLYIIYATYFVDMQDDYFNNKKMSVLTCRRYLIDLKIEACSLANGFDPIFLWVTENPNRQEKTPHILDIK